MAGTLFVVGTPIGNLEDVTARAARVLGEVDVVVAEDTRRTRTLLAHLGIRVRLISLPAVRERAKAGGVLDELRAGRHVALVTDAGMPGISDPGQFLIAACLSAGVPVTVVPGPSAAVAALLASGLASDRWAFEGFLPRKGRARAERLASVAADERTTVLFESPRRVGETLRDLAEACGGGRRAAVARELTKLHEEVRRGTLAELASTYADEEVRGEVTVVVEGAPPAAAPDVDDATLAEEAAELVAAGAKPREASAEIARKHGVPANRVYSALLARH
jgi:16S rRNA (cytidine1402-2'-O)-methyltransferase